MRVLPLLVVAWALACAADPRFVAHTRRTAGGGIAGAALDGAQLYTWGEQFLVWDLPGLHAKVLVARPRARSGRAGAIFDADRDGHDDLVAIEGDELVWRRGPG